MARNGKFIAMRTEEQVLKDFEEIGYAIDNNENFCEIEHQHCKQNILIYKHWKKFICCQLSWCDLAEPSALSINEFILLYELFRCWGWFNEKNI